MMDLVPIHLDGTPKDISYLDDLRDLSARIYTEISNVPGRFSLNLDDKISILQLANFIAHVDREVLFDEITYKGLWPPHREDDFYEGWSAAHTKFYNRRS